MSEKHWKRISRMTTNTIFFTQLYYPDMTTTAIIMTDLVEDLTSYGMNTKVVCAQPTYLVKRDCLKKEKHNGVSIRRVWSFLFDKNKIVGRILNSTSCFLSMLSFVFSTDKNNFLVFNTNPALLPFLGFIGSKLRGQKYLILVHDLWPELPAHTGMIKKGGLLYRAIDFVTRLSFKYASATVVLCQAMKKQVLNKAQEMDGSIHISITGLMLGGSILWQGQITDFLRN